MVTIARLRGMDLLIYSNDHDPAHAHVRKGGEWMLKVKLGEAGNPSTIDEDTYSDLVSVKWRKLALKLVEDNLDDCWDAWKRFHQD